MSVALHLTEPTVEEIRLAVAAPPDPRCHVCGRPSEHWTCSAPFDRAYRVHMRARQVRGRWRVGITVTLLVLAAALVLGVWLGVSSGA